MDRLDLWEHTRNNHGWRRLRRGVLHKTYADIQPGRSPFATGRCWSLTQPLHDGA